jgi:hypothetical protein
VFLIGKGGSVETADVGSAAEQTALIECHEDELGRIRFPTDKLTFRGMAVSAVRMRKVR